VLAHVRKATQGDKTVFNCHPFQHGRWVFAHNGDIPRFEDVRGALLELVDPWDDPIAYIPASSYGDAFTYRLGEGGSSQDVTLQAEMNPKTRAPWQFDTFQLRSAGPDGDFGTDDDVANFEIPQAEH